MSAQSVRKDCWVPYIFLCSSHTHTHTLFCRCTGRHRVSKRIVGRFTFASVVARGEFGHAAAASWYVGRASLASEESTAGVCVCVSVGVSVCASICLSVCMCACLLVCLSLCWCLRASVSRVRLPAALCLSLSLSQRYFLCPSARAFLCETHVSVCISVSISFCVLI